MVIAIAVFGMLAIGGILLSYRMGYRDGYEQARRIHNPPMSRDECEFSEFESPDTGEFDHG